MKKEYPGINIQYPISRLILSKEKTVETRTYPLPDKYDGVEMVLIETPGKKGNFKARIIALITFDGCFQYESKSQFTKDIKRHLVEPGSIWDWDGVPKWGWNISKIKRLRNPIEYKGNKGIKFTKSVYI